MKIFVKPLMTLLFLLLSMMACVVARADDGMTDQQVYDQAIADFSDADAIAKLKSFRQDYPDSLLMRDATGWLYIEPVPKSPLFGLLLV